MSLRSSSNCTAFSKAARSGCARWSTTAVTIPAAAARANPGASGRLASTNSITAGNDGSAAASSNADIFEPRPEIRIAVLMRVISGASESEGAGVDYRSLPRVTRDDGSHANRDLPCGSKRLGNGVRLTGFDDRDHADAAVEGAQHF